MDLIPFEEDNQHSKAQRRRVRLPERLDLIRRHFPEAAGLDWNRALRDNEVFAKVIRDVLKAQQHLGRSEEEQSIAGRRPNIDPEEGMLRWQELTGKAYSSLPFRQSFRVLAADRRTGRKHSMTLISRKTGISRSRVHRLMNGEEDPDLRDMEMIAEGYGRKPSFFTEYRVAAIVGFIAAKLETDPEISASLYQRIIR